MIATYTTMQSWSFKYEHQSCCLLMLIKNLAFALSPTSLHLIPQFDVAHSRILIPVRLIYILSPPQSSPPCSVTTSTVTTTTTTVEPTIPKAPGEGAVSSNSVGGCILSEYPRQHLHNPHTFSALTSR